MSEISLHPLLVLLPILIFGALAGLRRGWKDEAWTLASLLVIFVLFMRPEVVVLPALERLINAFLRAGQALLGRETSGAAFAFSESMRPWAIFLSFVTFAVLAYAVGHLIGKGEVGKGLWKMLGALLGGLNVIIVTSWLATRFIAARQENGNLQFTIPSFGGVAVEVGAPTTNNVMASWPGVIALLIVIILIVFLLTRAGRIWR